MIRQFNLNLAANETREVALSGVFFQIFQMLQPLVLVEILDKSGGVVSLIDTPLESMFIRADARFQTLRFTNGPTLQTVKFFYGDGDAGSNRFSGNVTGSVALDAATLAALESIDLNAASLASLNAPRVVRPEAITASYTSSAALVANTPDTIFTPAANANGAIILSANIGHYETASGGLAFLAKNAAPTGLLDGEVVHAMAFTNITYSLAMPNAVFVPAGKGLYYIANAATTTFTQNFRSCRYKLL